MNVNGIAKRGVSKYVKLPRKDVSQHTQKVCFFGVHCEISRYTRNDIIVVLGCGLWAVVYCVCRDHLGMKDNMSEFEKLVQGLTFTKDVYKCPAGTIQKAIANNDYMRYPIHRWPEGRSIRLAAELVKSLGIIP